MFHGSNILRQLLYLAAESTVGWGIGRILEIFFPTIRERRVLVTSVLIALAILIGLYITEVPDENYPVVFPESFSENIQYRFNCIFGAPYVVHSRLNVDGKHYLMERNGDIITKGDLYNGDDAPIYTVRTLFGTAGHYVIDPDTSTLVTNQINLNGCKRVKTDNESKNLYEDGNGLWVDGYQDIAVTVSGTAQNYCLDQNHKLLENACRTLVSADGKQLLGTEYYSRDGLSYAGWVLVSGSGKKRVLKYQSTLQEGGRTRHYLVTQLQYIPPSPDPDGTGKIIPGGWYLFDAYGTLIQKTGEYKNYVMDDAYRVISVDDMAPEMYLAVQGA